jgi:integrase/recombinase XerD
MLEHLFPSVEVQAWLQSGANASLIEGYADSMRARGFSDSTLSHFVHTAAHFGHWLDAEGVTASEVDDSVLDRFRKEHLPKCDCARSRPGTHAHTARGAARFLRYLRGTGIAEAPVETADPRSILVEEFSTWIQHQRGVTPTTAKGYATHVGLAVRVLGADPSCYEVSAVREFVLTHLRGFKPGYVKVIASALRTFLRFLVSRGQCKPEIIDAVPRTANWTLSDVPRHLSPEAVDNVVAAPDVNTRFGIRDRAVLLLLARLGLRASDVVGLRLSDFDWERGLVRVTGKGRRETWLPLPQDAGEGILAYLEHARPASSHDHLFLSMRVPFRPIRSTASIARTVREVIAQAGVQRPRGGLAAFVCAVCFGKRRYTCQDPDGDRLGSQGLIAGPAGSAPTDRSHFRSTLPGC